MTNTASTEYRHSASLTSTGRESIHRNDVHDADLGLRIPARYRNDWALFADWCAAADHNPIPAAPEALALFLHEHPATVATQRRRLSAINAVHTDHGYPAPGRTETVRRHLDAARAQRFDRLSRLLMQRAAELPSAGWPSGLFGRRDALLLILAATGMSFTDLTCLRRRDIRLDGDTLVVTTRAGECFRLAPDPDTGDNPAVSIYQRWADIQAFLDHYPGTHLLRHHLTDPSEIITDPLDAEQARQPLLCPIDRWGHLPHNQPMTPQSVSALVRAHLSGRAPVRRVLPVPHTTTLVRRSNPMSSSIPATTIAAPTPAAATTRHSRTSPTSSTRSKRAPMHYSRI